MLRNFKRGDVYLVELKENDSHIQKGIRPCVIVQNDPGNTFSPNLIIVPLTSKIKRKDLPVHVITGENQMALCECILTIPKEQIKYYMKTLDAKTMKVVNKALSISLGIRGRN